MVARLGWHRPYETWETLATEGKSEQAVQERSQEAEAVAPGSQEALHLVASPQARLPLIARLQTRILRFQVQEVAVEVGLQFISFLPAIQKKMNGTYTQRELVVEQDVHQGQEAHHQR